VKAAKAAAAAVAAGSAVAVSALSDGTVTANEVLGVVLAVLGAYGITWKVPNSETR
jgi:hypothetical protein